DGVDSNRLARRLRRQHYRLRSEVERNSEDVRVLDVEQPVLVEIVGLAAQRTPDNLLTQKLRTECTHPENVSHRVGVPSLRQHRDRYNTANRFAESPDLADGI